MVACLVSSAGAAAVAATTVYEWDDGLQALRENRYEAYAIYIGRQQSQMMDLLQRQEVDLGAVPVIHLSSRGQVTNPYSGRRVDGMAMIKNLTGSVNELTGGTFLWMDADGILIPELTVIQNAHRNRPAVIELYARLAVSPLLGKVSIAEFGRHAGLDIAQTLTVEAASGAHRDFSHLFRLVEHSESYVSAAGEGGTVYDPRTAAAIHVMTRSGRGEVFIAVMREFWEKMAVDVAGDTKRPPLVVLAPPEEDLSILDAMGIRYERRRATRETLMEYASPTIVLPGNGGQPATEISGFIPGEVVAYYILGEERRGLVNDRRVLHPDIPYGDVDRPASP